MLLPSKSWMYHKVLDVTLSTYLFGNLKPNNYVWQNSWFVPCLPPLACFSLSLVHQTRCSGKLQESTGFSFLPTHPAHHSLPASLVAYTFFKIYSKPNHFSPPSCVSPLPRPFSFLCGFQTMLPASTLAPAKIHSPHGKTSGLFKFKPYPITSLLKTL